LPGQTVCDIYTGSGAASVAALYTGRRCVVIEPRLQNYIFAMNRVREMASEVQYYEEETQTFFGRGNFF